MTEKLKVLDLFSGIGGFSLGLERTGGFETVAFCEIDPHCQKTLKKHWPQIRIFSDITNLKLKTHVDLVTAGFPCQDLSFAGQGAGLSGERSGLFWYILRTACMVGRPKLLLENVAALLNRGLCTVLGALATFGYDAEWHCIPASYVGAPHIRDRLWLISYPNAAENNIGSIRRIFSHDKMPRGDSSGTWGGAMPDISRMADGLPNSLDRLGELGNAVVPAIPEMLGYAILEAEFQNGEVL